jgi:CRP/FNR family transcriptional regulator
MEDLDASDLAEIERAAFLRVFREGQFLYSPGDASNAAFFLASGRVKVSRLSTHGKEFILDILGAGHLFGVTGVLRSEPRETFAEALERAAVWVVLASRFRALLTKRSEVALKLAHLMGRRQSLLETRLLDMAYKKAPQRLADLLLQLGETYGIHDARGILLPITLSQSVLGNLVGMSREMVNITLSDLKKSGVILLADRRVVIRNPEALAALAA